MTHYEATAATCTADGNSEYWYCAGCNKYFSDKNGKNEVEPAGVVLGALEHDWKAASCELTRRCSVCGYSDGMPLGHEFVEYESNHDATCTSDGTKTAICTRCSKTNTTIDSDSALGHEWGEYQSNHDATCTSDGTKTAACTRTDCTAENTVIDNGSVVAHSWGQWHADGNIHMRECSACGHTEYGVHSFDSGECTVCGCAEPQSGNSGGAISESGIEVIVENNRGYSQTYTSEGELKLQTAGVMGITSVSPDTGNEIIVSICFTATENLTLSSEIIGGTYGLEDIFLTLENSEGVTIEYHPVRFTLSFWENDGWVVEEGCSNLTMSEMQSVIAENQLLNRAVSAGEAVDIAFKIDWLWAEYIEEPDSFEIRGEDGQKYYFADSATDSRKWYISIMDTAIGTGNFSGTVLDTEGNSWTIQNANNNGTFSFYVSMAVERA